MTHEQILHDLTLLTLSKNCSEINDFDNLLTSYYETLKSLKSAYAKSDYAKPKKARIISTNSTK